MPTPDDLPPELTEKRRLTLFLRIYDALRLIALFSFVQSNEWAEIKATTMTRDTFTDNELEGYLDEIATHQKAKPASRTAKAMALVTQVEGGISDNGLVLEIIKIGFLDSPCAFVEINGETFFSSKKLKTYLSKRKEDEPLTGETVQEVKKALGFN